MLTGVAGVFGPSSEVAELTPLLKRFAKQLLTPARSCSCRISLVVSSAGLECFVEDPFSNKAALEGSSCPCICLVDTPG